MGIAICIKCGAIKKAPFRTCSHCSYNPNGDRRAMAQSLILSNAYYDEDTDSKPTKKQLDIIASNIRTGLNHDWNEQLIAKLINEQNELNNDNSPGWIKVILLNIGIIIVVIIPIVIVYAILKLYYMYIH
jgi:hypothetical protein